MVPSAQAWTPQECADWYAEHGSNHPDCQNYVPPPEEKVTVCVNGQLVEVPKSESEGLPTECEVIPPPEQPPVTTPVPPTPPAPEVYTVPEIPVVEDTPPEEAGPNVPPNLPIQEVKGKEQGGEVNGEHDIGTPAGPVAGTEQETGTLPFTGSHSGLLILIGSGLIGLSMVFYRLAGKHLLD